VDGVMSGHGGGHASLSGAKRLQVCTNASLGIAVPACGAQHVASP
jgi:hypothetical protein